MPTAKAISTSSSRESNRSISKTTGTAIRACSATDANVDVGNVASRRRSLLLRSGIACGSHPALPILRQFGDQRHMREAGLNDQAHDVHDPAVGHSLVAANIDRRSSSSPTIPDKRSTTWSGGTRSSPI